MSTSRLEAFSDGVLAIAATLLVLNIHVPTPEPGTSLPRALGAQWPAYAAYATSFFTIGIIWINHHAMISRLERVDHAIMTLNLGLLACVGVLPFTTALFATYLRQGPGQAFPAAIYGGSFLLVTVVFAATNRHILFPKAHLLRLDLDERQRRRILQLGVSGVMPYVVATLLAPISPYATLAICAAVAVFYATPLASATGPFAVRDMSPR